MFRAGILAAVAMLVQLSPAGAADWAEKMFQATSHDFGAVPRAAKVEYEFVLKNIYKEDVHIAGVRSSCGCTSPHISKDWLKTYEKSSIVAVFNTRTFSGQRAARLTVTIDKPFYAEVELQVRGYIRTDVVLNPGLVNLGTVDEGSSSERKVTIDYAGRNDWKILSANTASPYLSTDLKEVARGGGRVTYEMAVHVAQDAPSGYLNEELILETNDYRTRRFPVVVEGRIVSSLAISPSSLMLGILQPGQKVTKKVIVTGKAPFRIVDVRCDNESFKLRPTTSGSKTAQVVEVTFTAGNKPGKVAERIRIKTDSAEHPQVEVSAYGQITSPLAGT